MELKEDLYKGGFNNLDKLEDVMNNFMQHLQQAGYREEFFCSYMFHKVANKILNDIFDRFPTIDQDNQRRDMLSDQFKTMRKIYNKKYKEIDEFRRASVRSSKGKSKVIKKER